MTKPFWQLKHEWFIDAIQFELKQRWEFKLLLRKHPYDELTPRFKNLIDMCNKALEAILKDYKSIYGHKPNMRQIINEIEKENY